MKQFQFSVTSRNRLNRLKFIRFYARVRLGVDDDFGEVGEVKEEFFDGRIEVKAGGGV